MALGAARARGVLYGVTAAVAWKTAVAVLIGIAALANFIPARRAARIEPTVALRTD